MILFMIKYALIYRLDDFDNIEEEEVLKPPPVAVKKSPVPVATPYPVPGRAQAKGSRRPGIVIKFCVCFNMTFCAFFILCFSIVLFCF
jgi:hypothetical protein